MQSLMSCMKWKIVWIFYVNTLLRVVHYFLVTIFIFFPLDPSSKALVESQKMETQPTILHSLQQQYDASRYMTHVARGAGLGYGTDLQSREPFEQQSDKL